MAKVKCNVCKQYTHEKNTRKGLDEQLVCNTCWFDTFTKCSKCGKYEWKSKASKVNEKYLCSKCDTRSTYREGVPSGVGLCKICGKPFDGKKGVHTHMSKSH